MGHVICVSNLVIGGFKRRGTVTVKNVQSHKNKDRNFETFLLPERSEFRSFRMNNTCRISRAASSRRALYLKESVTATTFLQSIQSTLQTQAVRLFSFSTNYRDVTCYMLSTKVLLYIL